MPIKPNTSPEPADVAEVDKRLRKQFIVNGFFMSLALVLVPLLLIPSQAKLAHRFPTAFGWTTTGPKATLTPASMYPLTNADMNHMFTSIPDVGLDVVSAAIIMFVFWAGISRINIALVGYGRGFYKKRQWDDVATVLSSFNQQGQHFLDRTGEAHYLLAEAYQHLGKPQTAQKARDYVVKFRPKSEWAERLRQHTSYKPSPAAGHKVAVAANIDHPRPAKGKRRRF